MSEGTVKGIKLPLGRNVFAEVFPEDKLVITISLKEEGWVSQKGAGANLTKATTGGNILVPGTRNGKLGLNYFEPKV